VDEFAKGVPLPQLAVIQNVKFIVQNYHAR